MATYESKELRIFGLNMWQQVLVGLVLGIVVGFALGEAAGGLKVIGTVFMKLIKMVVSPLIFFALVKGITSLSDGENFGGMAVKGTLAYLSTSVIAVCLGLFLGTFFTPGVGVPIPSSDLEAAIKTPPPAIQEFLMGIIPGNIVHAMADDMYLQIVVFAIFTGIVINGLARNKDVRVDMIKELNNQMAAVIFKMIELIVRTAPLAVFGFMASMVGTTGHKAITSLAELGVLVIAACIFQSLFFGVLISVFAKLSPMPFYRKMIDTQVMAFSTSSSKATLTTAMKELENKMGVSKTTSNFMMPLGACINMDGTAIYLGICAMFFAQMYNVPIGGSDYLMLMLVCTLGSIGAAGVPSGSIIFMGMVLTSVGVPMEGVGIILGIDRILDMFRTTVNITGDAAITLIIDKTEGHLDEKAYNE
jgi:Na+/H+-dicarboxylate symporter